MPMASMQLDYGKMETLTRWSWCDALLYGASCNKQTLRTNFRQENFCQFYESGIQNLPILLFDKKKISFIMTLSLYRCWQETKWEEGIYRAVETVLVAAGWLKFWKHLPADRPSKFYQELLWHWLQRVARWSAPASCSVPVYWIRHLILHRKPVTGFIIICTLAYRR